MNNAWEEEKKKEEKEDPGMKEYIKKVKQINNRNQFIHDLLDSIKNYDSLEQSSPLEAFLQNVVVILNFNIT